MKTWQDLERPRTFGMTTPEMLRREAEMQLLAVALRERAGELRAACKGRAALAISELEETAARLWKRAEAYHVAAFAQFGVEKEQEEEEDQGERHVGYVSGEVPAS